MAQALQLRILEAPDALLSVVLIQLKNFSYWKWTVLEDASTITTVYLFVQFNSFCNDCIDVFRYGQL